MTKISILKAWPARLRSVLLPIVVALTAIGSACSGGTANSQAAQGPPPVPVKIEVAQSRSLNDSTEYVATLKSRDAAIIMPQVEGQITDIYVHSGDHVAPGKVLMQIDPAKQQATVKSQEQALAAQQANLAWAKQQYERISALATAGVVSKQDLDQAKS